MLQHQQQPCAASVAAAKARYKGPCDATLAATTTRGGAMSLHQQQPENLRSWGKVRLITPFSPALWCFAPFPAGFYPGLGTLHPTAVQGFVQRAKLAGYTPRLGIHGQKAWG